LEVVVVQGINVTPGQRGAGVGQPDLARDRRGGDGVITGDHLDADARGLTRGHGVDRLGTRRIDETEQPEEHKAVVHIAQGKLRPAGFGRLLGDRQHAITLRRHLIHPLLPGLTLQRLVPIAHAQPPAHFEKPLRRALDAHEALTAVIVVQCRHELLHRIEGDEIRARVVLTYSLRIEAGLDRGDHQGRLHRIPERGPGVRALRYRRVVAQHRGSQRFDDGRIACGCVFPLRFEKAAVRVVASPGDVQPAVARDKGTDRHLVAGQCSGLVGTDHSHRSQRLHRR